MSPFIFKVPAVLNYAEVQKLISSDGLAGDNFSTSIAVENNTLVIGAYLADVGANTDQGAVYVYEDNGSSWIQVQKLLASDGADSDRFGDSVAIDGTTIVIGAYLVDVGGNSNQGVVYVFEKSGTWVEVQKLLASDGLASELFGWSVAIDGTTIVIGALLADIGGNIQQGAAYVFEKAGTWPVTETQKLVASDGLADDRFGQSVVVIGTTIVIGAYLVDVGGNVGQGAVYVFEKSGTWVEVQKLLASDGADSDVFGEKIAISGTTMVVGARLADVGGNIQQGAAYVFEKAGTWVEVQKLLASDGLAGDQFGWDVAISGTMIVVGAYAADPGGNNQQGAAYVYEYDGSSWTETIKLVASDGLAGDQFGWDVAIRGATLVIGANTADPGGNNAQGAVYVFEK